MKHVYDALRRLIDDLNDAAVRYALVGGLAVSARTEPRFTRDIDVAVAVDSDLHAEQLIHALLQRGYRCIAIVEQKQMARMATCRLQRIGDDNPILDLLFASSGIEEELTARATVLTIVTGIDMPVAQIPDLLAMKLLSSDPSRPKDEIDIQALLQVSKREDIEATRERLRLIAERGFHRKRQLLDRLDDCLVKYGWQA